MPTPPACPPPFQPAGRVRRVRVGCGVSAGTATSHCVRVAPVSATPVPTPSALCACLPLTPPGMTMKYTFARDAYRMMASVYLTPIPRWQMPRNQQGSKKMSP
eukprot:CAMPEP_0117805324 /NCGR_PEP_ID=MMETSP0948-20121206/17771_1 /TAXON_ID=44440 /ORGANISM="Chattonella subsalsa, Strain CCMP2191" /LENGTH=102 /DNA_ID=CAMNT_0005639319 /DNA_START=605 /DNA_END=916 /DNA_ORIENTATION=+